MHTRRGFLLVTFCAVATQAPIVWGCSDNTAPGAALVASWNATSFTGQGQDYIAQGMALTVRFTDAGTYSVAFTNDLVGACNPGPDCTNNGD